MIVLVENKLKTWFRGDMTGTTTPTQNIQGALVVRDDDIRPFCLQVLPAAHFNSKPKQVLDMTDHRTDNPGQEKGVGGKKVMTVLKMVGFRVKLPSCSAQTDMLSSLFSRYSQHIHVKLQNNLHRR